MMSQYSLIILTSSVVTCVLTYLYWKLRQNFGILEKLGIPVIRPILCFGSAPTLFRRLQQFDDLKRMRKYGNIWGLYEGICPQVYVADANIVGQILHTDFSVFPGPRHLFNFQHPMAHEALPQIDGIKWIALRDELNRFFAPTELGGMRLLMKQCTQAFMQHMKKTVSPIKPYVLKSFYEGVALDILARCVFGLKIFSLNEKNARSNEFLKYARRIIKGQDVSQFTYFITTLFPALLKRAEPYTKKDLDYLRNMATSQMKERKASGDKYGDFIDVLNDLEKLVNTEDFQAAEVGLNTLLSQVFTLLVANFASITMTMTLTCYHLATYPELQKRAYLEVKEYFASQKDGCDDCALHLPFLTRCIKETLRIYPVVVRLERQCTRQWKPTQNESARPLVLPKDTVVKIPIYAIHHNEQYFPEPETFNPDRFLPDASGAPRYPPNSFLPLGLGPRNCLGYHFAFDEMKIVLSHMIRDFEFSMRKETNIKQTPGVLYIAESVRIADLPLGLIPRNRCS